MQVCDYRHTEPLDTAVVLWERNGATLPGVRPLVVELDEQAVEDAICEQASMTRLETRTAAAFGLFVPRWIVWVVRWVTGGRRSTSPR